MATTRSQSSTAWLAMLKTAFVGNQRIKSGRPRCIVSAAAPDCAAKVGTLCWDQQNDNAYICTEASGTWVKINA